VVPTKFRLLRPNIMQMEYAMRFSLASTAVGLVLAAGIPAAQAQTVITPGVNPSVETIQTMETTRTVRPAPRNARRQVVTTRTVTRQVAPTTTVVARTVQPVPRPLYDEVTPAPVATGSDDDYYRPIYDQVTPAEAAAVAAPAGSAPFAYRYVYEPDRILVVDPTTNIAVQSIPR
jgi:hypothetical protein